MMESSQLEYKKYLNLVRIHKELFLVLALLLMTAVFAVSYLLPRQYKASSTVFIEKNVISELVKGISVTPSVEDTITVLTSAITSRTLIRKAVDSLDSNIGRGSHGTEELIDRLQQHTLIKVEGKNQFTVSLVDRDPKVARDFVNSLVRLYIRENVSLKRGESNDATTFLSEQMANLRSNLEQTESRVNAYKRENSGIISRDEGKLFEEINTAQQKLYDLQLRRRQLEGMRVITRKSNDPLQAKLAALQKKLQDLRVQYTDSYPEVVSVKGDVETVNQQLQARKGESQPLDPHELARIESEIGAIEMTEAGLQQYVAANRKVLQSIPSAKAGLEKLQLEQSNQKAVYDQLFSRHGQSELSTQMEVQDKSTRFRVIDPAVLPVKPVSPDRLKIMLLGIIGSIAASFGLLVLLDMLDDSVKEVESAKQLGLPILAIIPKMEEPALVARQRRRFLLFSIAAAAYFLIILCLPAMELLRLPYMDQLVDQLSSARP